MSESPASWRTRFAQLMIELDTMPEAEAAQHLSAFSESLLDNIRMHLAQSIEPDVFNRLLKDLDTVNACDPTEYQFSLWLHTGSLNLPIAGCPADIGASPEETFRDDPATHRGEA